MRIDILTLFPETVSRALSHSIVGRAIRASVVDIRVHDLRQWTTDRHRTADDVPFGGGAGMVLKAEPLIQAISDICGGSATEQVERILLCPQGDVLTQATVAHLSAHSRVLLVCGHYEGIDERVRALMIDRQVSIGDFVVSGGELPALILADAIVRLLPGALGSPESTVDESHTEGLLEYPHFTRPAIVNGHAVPPVLRSGDHKAVDEWRRMQSISRTRERRPDLYARWWVAAQVRRSMRTRPMTKRNKRGSGRTPPDLSGGKIVV
ncbi:MAG: tRNA (guanosine(37)-N1)-methyltransferase TrmD [Chloroflexi bacterium]|nr:tRNA (guanosine(37)-N1)-methyltransferase TrmD [Chloroflexota bacterium]